MAYSKHGTKLQRAARLATSLLEAKEIRANIPMTKCRELVHLLRLLAEESHSPSWLRSHHANVREYVGEAIAGSLGTMATAGWTSSRTLSLHNIRAIVDALNEANYTVTREH